MKKIVFVLAIALMGTFVTNAQPQRHHGPKGPHATPEQMMERRVDMLDKALSLTDEQKAEITKIYAMEMEAMAKARPEGLERSDNGERPDEAKMKAWKEEMEAQRAATDARIEALLTPEQLAKYAEMKKHEGPRGHGKRHDFPRDGKERLQHKDGGKPCTCPQPEEAK